MSMPPTLYEYYTSGGVESGLSANQPTFTLNNKNITIYSGALHYFRVPPAYWRDRLRKMRAAGLNAVETYVPWNLHEPEPRTFDFGDGSTEFSEFLDIKKFLQIAQEEDLLAIVRPGPYICAEWEFGGLPSWILRSDIKIRTSDVRFIDLDKPIFELSLLKQHQPSKPLMVMEYWTGWFDHWAEKHHTRTSEAFAQVLGEILSFNSSVNMYMFHGGTNWGFLNGANIKDLTTDNSAYQPDTTSYDYDAPLSEAGDYTDKYFKVKELIQTHNTVVTKLPKQPELVKRIAYPSVKVEEMMTLDDMIKQSEHNITSQKLLPMELLNVNNNAGQSYGYVVYKKENVTIAANSVLKIEGHVCDTVMVLIDGQLKSKILETQDDLNGFGYWRLKDSTLSLGEVAYTNATLELVVENWGRNNYGKLNQFNQHKGLWQGNVSINDAVLENWQIIPLEFKKNWTNSLQNWKKIETNLGPALYRATFQITDLVDTYIDMREWTKGFIIVNGFVLARFLRLGPQQTAYLPAPFLKKGLNTILIFEHFTPGATLKFQLKCRFNELIMAVTNVTLPTLYEYYTSGGINSGLSANQSYFTLNDKNITIYSGAMHYFRVPKEYWRDRLRKMRAAGLNCVETYVPWNLHEPANGYFDFGSGGSDMEDFLDVQKFLKTAQEEDLFAIIRPGPFICSEWEFGGFPSWLLRQKGIKVRTSDPVYMKFVSRYFNTLLSLLAIFQFTRGGPIIAFQVENEYGSTEEKGKFTPDKVYLEQLRQLMINNSIVELLVTSDSPTGHGTAGTLPGVFLQTANFADNPEKEFDRLKELQPNKPIMAMEFWTGWFDHWSEIHHVRDDDDFYDVLDRILKYPASVNMYMFHGGTSWGFLNGANVNNAATDNSGYQPDTTSYDYDAPLSEIGDYTIKYLMVKELLAKYNTIQTKIPQAPSITKRKQYPSIAVKGQLLLNEIIKAVPISFQNPNVLPMELLPLNNLSGQSYGYIIYRKENLTIPANSVLTIAGRVCDTAVVLIDGYLLNKPLTKAKDLNGFGYWRVENSSINLSSQNLTGATLDIMVENWGRNNFGHLDQFNQFKGLWQGGVYINDVELQDWQIIPLEFKKSWTNSLTGWHPPIPRWTPGPAAYKAVFTVDDVQDTYINMQNWVKGVVIVNGFVLGRYAVIGPQQTLYLPAPFIKKGDNTIVVFEHFSPAGQVEFSAKPIFKTAPKIQLTLKAVIMAVTTLPTLYEYYTAGGINSGLSVDNPYFTLNGKNITLYSGATHYFRVPKEYWRDRLRKMRAAGLNAVETYIPWNLHEPQIGQYDFGDGDSDMTDFLDLKKYIKTAQEEDLFVIVRPGPYICAEWEFGGLPSWLLREKNVKVRTSDPKFMKHVRRYFGILLQLLATLQFTRGGPIIAFQVENEYGSTESKKFTPDKSYIQQLRDLMVNNGITELLFTSDSPTQHGDVGTLPNLFQTANFARDPEKEFDRLRVFQKNKPSMAMEFWTGWFDHWSEPHHQRNNTEYREVLERILKYPASVNLYMFHGGTNWGFLNGANIPSGPAIYQPDTTSYDYDAPLSETGDYTEKYFITKELIEKYNEIKTKLPELPELTSRTIYPTVEIENQLKYLDIVDTLPNVFKRENLLPMELLPLNNNSGQSYGYIIYRKNLDLPPNSILAIKGPIHDSVLVLVDGKLISPQLQNVQDLDNFGYWRLDSSTLKLPQKINATLDIVVVNWGRNNFGKLEQFKQFKGLYENEVLLNMKELTEWRIIPLEFKKTWFNSLSNWGAFSPSNLSLNFATFDVDELQDTFVDMREWNTGIVIVNGFVLGRYMRLGPQQALYLPAPLLKRGENEIAVFEHFTPATRITFSNNPIYSN
ncbi:beta-galactosidase-1-like protein 2 [Asbolus verrucosus]|uniref:Beta-galactosidase n=1 Tax=Asbolus verrucosus TaxID=1661398 RepID=A0A482W4S9_ASBVE|nr:beta-galactosidase-1-like protein 2 [Asbolus verrucosus]